MPSNLPSPRAVGPALRLRQPRPRDYRDRLALLRSHALRVPVRPQGRSRQGPRYSCRVHVHKPPSDCLSADPPRPHCGDVIPTGVSVRAPCPRHGDSPRTTDRQTEVLPRAPLPGRTSWGPRPHDTMGLAHSFACGPSEEGRGEGPPQLQGWGRADLRLKKLG